MAPERPARRGTRGTRSRSWRARLSLVVLLGVLALGQVPLASAHGATATGGLSRWHGVIVAFVGLVLVGGAVSAKRTDRVAPTTALNGVFVGIVLTALGVILFDGLSPDSTYTASSFPFPRSWYPPIALGLGLLIIGVSFVVGWRRWPTRPRYAFLGVLAGVWIAYPTLVPGPGSIFHPLGYAVVVATPILVGYILWTDTGDVLRAVFSDSVARRFGVGIAIVAALFFLTITGYLSFFPEEGIPHRTAVVVLPVVYQLVTWPTLEIYLPHVPLFLALSPGQLLVVGTMSALIGLNAALIARYWRMQERAGTTHGTVGTAAIVGSCTCGCCGPLLAKVAVLAAGPSVAAPIYWMFVDTASPLSALFVVGSILLFTGSLLYSVRSTRRPDRSASIATAD